MVRFALHRRHGQIASMDAIFSLFLLMSLALSFSQIVSLFTPREYDTYAAFAESFVDRITFSEGLPLGWNKTNVIIPGVSCGSGEICFKKLVVLNETCGSRNFSGYHLFKKKYEYRIEVDNVCYCGCDGNESTSIRAVATRAAVLNHTIVSVKVSVYPSHAS